jgi:hypothetical protein
MALLLRTLESVQRSPSTLSFAQYREAESQNYKQTSVTSDGELLDVLTLELRVHPPNVRRLGWAGAGRGLACPLSPLRPPLLRVLLPAAQAAPLVPGTVALRRHAARARRPPGRY